jgi:hypothetical protein
MESNSQPGWCELRGQEVQISHKGVLVRTGYVEEVTQAGDGLWLESRGNDSRTLYLKAEGYSAQPLQAAAHSPA